MRLHDTSGVEFVSPVYLADGLEGVPFDEFVVQFDATVTREQVEALNALHHVEIVSESTAAPGLYVLRITPDSDLSVLRMSQRYYERLPAEWSMPDFVVSIELHNDPR